MPDFSNKDNIKSVVEDLIKHFHDSSSCKIKCSPSFKAAFQKDKAALNSRLVKMTESIIKNEILNPDYVVFYHGFRNDFRLYQGVLRAVKSFEFLIKLDSTYPFPDFVFDDQKVKLPNFLKNWWKEYLDYVEEKNLSPFPKKNEKAPGKSVGLTLYPDSIPYAQNYLLSTNASFLGHSTSPMNSTVFFLLNSTSATGLDIVDTLIEKTLSPYLKTDEGKTDHERLDSILSALKEVFEPHMARSGSQVAQIFIKKDVASLVSFMAWNSGEPIWLF